MNSPNSRMTGDIRDKEDVNTHGKPLELSKATKRKLLKAAALLSIAYGLFTVLFFMGLSLIFGASISRIPFIPFFTISISTSSFLFHYIFLRLVFAEFTKQLTDRT